LTAGLGIGAGVSGVLAQWGPLPTLVPYALQILLSVVAVVFLLGAPETSPLDTRHSLLADLRIPRHARRRFLRVVLPLAPWVFGSAALAYAVTPALVGSQVGDETIAFATLLTVLTLAAGAAVQPFTRLIARMSGGRNALVGMSLILAGIILCAVDAGILSIPLAMLVAIVLGLGYGICLVAGLVEIQDLIRPHDLGSLTGIYYSLTYIGFALPALLAALSDAVPYVASIGVVALLCLGCLLLIAVSGGGARSPRAVDRSAQRDVR
jgi:MFS family permease